MKYNPLTRRMFLQGAGATFAIPLEGIIDIAEENPPRKAKAASVSRPCDSGSAST